MRLRAFAVASALLLLPAPIKAQQWDWGALGGLAGYKRLALTAQAEASIWASEGRRVGPALRGLLFFEPFDMVCGPEPHESPEGGLCNNPLQTMASIGLRATSEHRDSSGPGIFAEAAWLPMKFERGSTSRWGLGAGVRYRTRRLTAELSAMAIPESAQVMDYLLFAGVGVNRSR